MRLQDSFRIGNLKVEIVVSENGDVLILSRDGERVRTSVEEVRAALEEARRRIREFARSVMEEGDGGEKRHE